jgi:hypothetical protein
MSQAIPQPNPSVSKAISGSRLIFCKLFTNVPGSLPLTSPTFTTNGGTILLTVAGSGYLPEGAASAAVGCDILIDKEMAGASLVFANNTLMHLATIPVTYIIENLPVGEHTITLQAHGTTVTDGNDFFNAYVEEYVTPGEP